MHFYEFAPWLAGKMPAKGEPQIVSAIATEPGPRLHARSKAVRTDDPICVHLFFAQRNSAVRNARNGSSPKQFDAARFSCGHKLAMKKNAPDSKPGARRKSGFRASVGIDESDSAKHSAFAAIKKNAKPFKSSQTLGKDSFAARLVAGKTAAIRDSYAQTFPAQCNRGYQPGWTAANHECMFFRTHGRDLARQKPFLRDHLSESLIIERRKRLQGFVN
jgi:hypothetical protein